MCVSEVREVPKRQRKHRFTSTHRYLFHKKPQGLHGERSQSAFGNKRGSTERGQILSRGRN